MYDGLVGIPRPAAFAQGRGHGAWLDKQKLTEGKELIRYFCNPDRDGARHLPSDAPDKWAQFKAYNLRDVEVELGIQARLREYPAPEEVWAQYRLDQQINDRGIAVDMELVRSAISLDARTRGGADRGPQRTDRAGQPPTPCSR